MSDIRVFGVRHHGPGSARGLLRALEEFEPDAVLVEGPPEGNDLLPLLLREDMGPPVALLVYNPKQPRQAAYFPFAEFSPEWQALRYGLSRGIDTQFIDLPQANQMPLRMASLEEPQDDPPNEDEGSPVPDEIVPFDPLSELAQAAGYGDGELWWERTIGQRRNTEGLFTIILEAMTTLRETLVRPCQELESRREAYMRRMVRAARRKGYERIAVVCGAWHAPALVNMPTVKSDNERLKGLPKIKTTATWVPWTYDRLDRATGYGAGITSPGWYHHLWHYPENTITHWVSLAAHLLREKDLVASTAQVIDTVRLADSLAALRGFPTPGLFEANEAIQSTLCDGQISPMALIHRKLVVGERLGAVPADTPVVPLQNDLQAQQKRLRMKPEINERVYDLDLRTETNLKRSHLLHRLDLLGIPWGAEQQARGKKGTFHEIWQVCWQPEFAVGLIEAALWGNTVRDAASAYAQDMAGESAELPTLTTLLQKSLLADLPDAVTHIMGRIEVVAALAGDAGLLMDALLPLANVLRYGNVRQTDTDMIHHVVDGLVTRICIGLPGACASLDDDAAALMFKRIIQVNGAITMLQNERHITDWQAVLTQMLDQSSLHGMVAGRCCRILFDANLLDSAEAARRMGMAFSLASEPVEAASWVEGFLTDSGLLLVHDRELWAVVDRWVIELPADTFKTLLPLLRRTFSTFEKGERRQIADLVKQGPQSLVSDDSGMVLDEARAALVMPVLAQYLGMEQI